MFKSARSEHTYRRTNYPRSRSWRSFCHRQCRNSRFDFFWGEVRILKTTFSELDFIDGVSGTLGERISVWVPSFILWLDLLPSSDLVWHNTVNGELNYTKFKISSLTVHLVVGDGFSTVRLFLSDLKNKDWSIIAFPIVNIPIVAVALALVVIFLRVKIPETTWQQKWRQVDWANGLFIVAST